MKKVILPLVALMLSMVACQKENEGILTLEVEEYNTDAKLHLNNDYAVWDDDCIWINGMAKYVTLTNTTATISTSLGLSAPYNAIYPYDWVEDDGSITYPETQTYRTNATGKQVIDAPMAAYSDGGNLKFHNLGSILAVNVTNSTAIDVVIDTIEVTAAGTTLLNGTATIDYANNTLSALTNGTSTTTLNLVDAYTETGVTIAKNATKTFYIALPPTTAKLTITIKDYPWNRSISQSNAHTFEANHGYNAPFNFAPPANEIWYTSNASRVPFDATSSLFNTKNKQGVNIFADSISTIPQSWYIVTNLITVTLPASVTTLDTKAFYECDKLTSIVMPGVTTLGDEVFERCSVLSDISLSNITTIGASAFKLCASLSSVTMPNVTVLPIGAFYQCTSLETASIPNVATISPTAFAICTSLTSITMTNVSSIMNKAFVNCSSLAHIYSNSTSPTTYATSFLSVPNTATLHLPSSCQDTTWTGWNGNYAYDL